VTKRSPREAFKPHEALHSNLMTDRLLHCAKFMGDIEQIDITVYFLLLNCPLCKREKASTKLCLFPPRVIHDLHGVSRKEAELNVYGACQS
jgi:hypothetical protein